LGGNLKNTILQNSKTPSSESNNRRLSAKRMQGCAGESCDGAIKSEYSHQ
jgi:hypothetical protein